MSSPTPEIWLRTNRRALATMMVLPTLLLSGCTLGLIWSLATRQSWFITSMLGLFVFVLLWLFAGLTSAMLQPRIAYQEGELLVYLEFAKATRLPIDIVEVFFLGQGPSELPKLKGREPETQNVIVRLAESATEWKHRDVRPAIALWCEGYITIRGSWCEPITPEIMRRLNHRLAEIQRERKAARREAEAAS
jgi:hypothetical protein